MITSPDNETKIELILEGVEQPFTVPYYMFCSYSKIFRKDFDFKKYVVKSKVPEATFKSFLSACQGKYYMVNDKNFQDLMKLCIEFQCDTIKNDIIEFAKEHKTENIIAAYSSLCMLKSIGNSSSDTEELASKIAENLDKYIDEKSLLALNKDALSRILFHQDRNKNVEESQIFGIIKAKEEDKDCKEDITELYSHLHLEKLKPEDTDFLFQKSLDKIPKSFDTEYFWPFLCYIYKTNRKQEETINELKTQLESFNEVFEKKFSPLQAKAADYDQWKQGKEDEYGQLAKLNQDLAKDYQDLQQKYKTLNEKFGKLSEKQDKNDKVYATRFPFKGIVYNYKRNNKNIEDLIKIITPPDPNSYAQKYNPYDLFEYEGAKIDNCYYHNLNKFDRNSDNWIDFNFVEKFKFYGFSIRTSCFGECFSHPKKFQILGSNDREHWEEICQIDDEIDQFLNGSCLTHTYIFEDKDYTYTYIRFLQTDAHFQYKDGFGIIALSAIEFFGKEDNS